MKHLRRNLPLLVLLLMLAAGVTSCRDAGVRDALQHAEALMETDPHAARAVLDSIEIVNSKLSNRTDYHAAMAWYTLGCAYTDIEDDLRGIDAFLKAKLMEKSILLRRNKMAQTGK